MKLYTPFVIFIVVCMFGCLGSQQTAIQTPETEAEEATPLAVLEPIQHRKRFRWNFLFKTVSSIYLCRCPVLLHIERLINLP